jgi:hypothetical protein
LVTRKKTANRITVLSADVRKLTLELEHHKRLKFGGKAETLNKHQRDPFPDSVVTDFSAMQTELKPFIQSSVYQLHEP